MCRTDDYAHHYSGIHIHHHQPRGSFCSWIKPVLSIWCAAGLDGPFGYGKNPHCDTNQTPQEMYTNFPPDMRSSRTCAESGGLFLSDQCHCSNRTTGSVSSLGPVFFICYFPGRKFFLLKNRQKTLSVFGRISKLHFFEFVFFNIFFADFSIMKKVCQNFSPQAENKKH